MEKSIQREYVMFTLHNISLAAELDEAGANNIAAWLVKWLEEC